MSVGNIILDSIYPRCCPLCHKIVVPGGELVCESCLEKLQPIGQPRCMRCGKSLTDPAREYCRDCTMREHRYSQGIGIYPYNQTMKSSIEMYKARGRREYGDFYVSAMAHYGKSYILRWKPDCLIPVPMHPNARRRRGFNQAEYLARGLGEIFGIPVETEGVRRVVRGTPQKSLDAKSRRQKLRGVFAAVPGYCPPKRVLIIDDVYTTGSTIDALTEILLENQAEKVFFLTLCQGKGL